MSEQKLDSRVAHRQAGLVAGFLWQDQAAEGDLDAKAVEVDYTTVLGTLPEPVNGAPAYLVHVQGTATSTFGYSYPIELTLKVSLRPSEDEDGGEPIVAEATEEEEAACEQHGRDLACKEYAELMHIVTVGAYTESSEDGSYWYPDKRGQNISERIDELDSGALEQGLHFARSQVEGKEVYILEPATQEELDAYAKAKEEAEEEDE